MIHPDRNIAHLDDYIIRCDCGLITVLEFAAKFTDTPAYALVLNNRAGMLIFSPPGRTPFQLIRVWYPSLFRLYIERAKCWLLLTLANIATSLYPDS